MTRILSVVVPGERELGPSVTLKPRTQGRLVGIPDIPLFGANRDVRHGFAHVVHEARQRTRQNPSAPMVKGDFRRFGEVEDSVLRNVHRIERGFQRMREQSAVASMMRVLRCAQKMNEVRDVPDGREKVPFKVFVRQRHRAADPADQTALLVENLPNRKGFVEAWIGGPLRVAQIDVAFFRQIGDLEIRSQRRRVAVRRGVVGWGRSLRFFANLASKKLRDVLPHGRVVHLSRRGEAHENGRGEPIRSLRGFDGLLFPASAQQIRPSRRLE